MTVVRVEWGGASDTQRQRMFVHLKALRDAGAEVVESDTDDLVLSTAEGVLRYLAYKNTTEGEVVSQQDITQLQAGQYLNPQQKAQLEKAFEYLVDIDVLSYGKDKKLKLTATGLRRLYS